MAKCQMRSRMSLSSMREKYLKAGGASSVMLESWTLEVLLEGMATSGELLTSCSIGPSDMGRCSRNILVDSFLLFESRRFRVVVTYNVGMSIYMGARGARQTLKSRGVM
jgi:hypothetical protein